MGKIVQPGMLSIEVHKPSNYRLGARKGQVFKAVTLRSSWSSQMGPHSTKRAVTTLEAAIASNK